MDVFLLKQLLELRTNILNFKTQFIIFYGFHEIFNFSMNVLYSNRIVLIITECMCVCARKYEIRDVIRKL